MQASAKRWQLKQAALCVRSGGVIAYPTEAVYGLGCDPLDHEGVIKILSLKHRNIDKGLILIAANQQQLEPFIETPTPEIQAKLDSSWPGPVTWLLKARADVPQWITGSHNTIAVRVTAHPLASALCVETGMALISTSANISRRAAARSALQVRQQFSTGIDYILNGPVDHKANPTEIRHAVTGATIR